MTRRLRHRGPDGEGVWSEPGVVFGHRRLSILDLSQGGHQPMVLGAHVLTYNGEIYNHQELRAALPGPWHSSGDTEVLLHLLARRGSACLQQVIGMFAFAHWDARCAAAAAGARPARHQAAVLPDPAGRHRVCLGAQGAAGARQAADRCRSAVRDFLFHGYVPAPKTIYLRHLRSCRPAMRSPGRTGASRSSGIGALRADIDAENRGRHPGRSSMSCCARSCRRTPSRTFRSACS